MSVTIKAGTLDTTIDVQTVVSDNYLGRVDEYLFRAMNSSLGFFTLNLRDMSGTAVNGFALPTAAVDYAAFQNLRRLTINGQHMADITSFAVAETADVPEPATAGLLGLGLAAVAFARRRKQRAPGGC